MSLLPVYCRKTVLAKGVGLCMAMLWVFGCTLSSSKNGANPESVETRGNNGSGDTKTTGPAIEIEFDPTAFRQVSDDLSITSLVSQEKEYRVVISLLSGEMLADSLTSADTDAVVQIKIPLSEDLVKQLKLAQIFKTEISGATDIKEVIQAVEEEDIQRVSINPSTVLASKLFKNIPPSQLVAPIVRAAHQQAKSLDAKDALPLLELSRDQIIQQESSQGLWAVIQNTTLEIEEQENRDNTEMSCKTKDVSKDLWGSRLIKSNPDDLLPSQLLLVFKPAVWLKGERAHTYHVSYSITVAKERYTHQGDSYTISGSFSGLDSIQQGGESYIYNRSQGQGKSVDDAIIYTHLPQDAAHHAQILFEFAPLVEVGQADFGSDRFEIRVVFTEDKNVKISEKNFQSSISHAQLEILCRFKFRPIGFKHDEPITDLSNLAVSLPLDYPVRKVGTVIPSQTLTAESILARDSGVPLSNFNEILPSINAEGVLVNKEGNPLSGKYDVWVLTTESDTQPLKLKFHDGHSRFDGHSTHRGYLDL